MKYIINYIIENTQTVSEKSFKSRNFKLNIMKKITQLMFVAFLLITSIMSGQTYKDTIINVKERKLNYEYDVQWTRERLTKEIEIFIEDQYKPTLKSSTQIISILNKIPLSKDACINSGFEDDYASWTGLGLKHSTNV